LSSSPAYLLLLHGSHDRRYAASVEQFCQSLPGVEVAYLDCAPTPLHEQIQAFGKVANATQLVLLPLFLLPGVHVMTDIPDEVAQAQAAMPDLPIVAASYLGSNPDLAMTLQQSFEGLGETAAGRIIISHGSRRSGGNQPVIDLAEAVGAIPAYWSVEPSLTMQVMALADRGQHHITVLPYMLFEGSLTDGIRQELAAIQVEHPHLNFTLLPTIAQQPECLQLIRRILTQQSLTQQSRRELL
jgi:sirohydrochlorin cobaltochelatase